MHMWGLACINTFATGTGMPSLPRLNDEYPPHPACGRPACGFGSRLRTSMCAVAIMRLVYAGACVIRGYASWRRHYLHGIASQLLFQGCFLALASEPQYMPQHPCPRPLQLDRSASVYVFEPSRKDSHPIDAGIEQWQCPPPCAH